MALAMTNRCSTVNGVNATSFNFSVTAPSSSCWLIVDVVSRCSSGTPAMPAPSGGGLSYGGQAGTYEATVTSATVRRLTRFVAWVDTTPGAFTLAVDFGVQEQSICAVMVNEVTGGDTGSICVTGNSVTNSGTATGASVTLNAFASADNRPLLVSANWGSDAITAEAGWTQLAETAATENMVMETAWHSSTADVTATNDWSPDAAAWYGIASELAVATGGGGEAVLDPFGMSGFFGA